MSHLLIDSIGRVRLYLANFVTIICKFPIPVSLFINFLSHLGFRPVTVVKRACGMFYIVFSEHINRRLF